MEPLSPIAQSHSDWFKACLARAVDPGDPITTYDKFVVKYRDTKEKIRLHYAGLNRSLDQGNLQYMVAACTWWHYFGTGQVPGAPDFIYAPDYVAFDVLPPALQNLHRQRQQQQQQQQAQKNRREYEFQFPKTTGRPQLFYAPPTQQQAPPETENPQAINAKEMAEHYAKLKSMEKPGLAFDKAVKSPAPPTPAATQGSQPTQRALDDIVEDDEEDESFLVYPKNPLRGKFNGRCVGMDIGHEKMYRVTGVTQFFKQGCPNCGGNHASSRCGKGCVKCARMDHQLPDCPYNI